MKGRAVALLYADWTASEATPLTSKETHLLKDLAHEIEAVLNTASPTVSVAASA